MMDSGDTSGCLCLQEVRATLRVKSTIKKSKPGWKERQGLRNNMSGPGSRGPEASTLGFSVI